MKRINTPLLYSVAGAWFAFCGSTVAAELQNLEVSLISDSNPAKAQFDRDIESTTAARGTLRAGVFSKPLENDAQLAVNASVSLEFNDIEGLGESVYLAGAEWSRENKDAKFAPLYSLRGEAGYLDSETDIRDSFLVGLIGSVNWQIEPFFDTTLGARIDLREADTAVFDGTKLQLFGSGNFSLSQRLVLSGGLRVVVGKEVSTATPTVNIVQTADDIEPDDAFGGFDARRFAYSLDATSVLLEFSASYDVTPMLNVNAGYRYVNTTADNSIDYQRNLFELSVRYSFN